MFVAIPTATYVYYFSRYTQTDKGLCCSDNRSCSCVFLFHLAMVHTLLQNVPLAKRPPQGLPAALAAVIERRQEPVLTGAAAH